MHKHTITGIAAALIAFSGFISTASAQQQTQSIVYQDAGQAANDSSHPGDGSSRPAADPAYTAQVAHSSGADTHAGQATAATKTGAPVAKAQTGNDATPNSKCVGPAGFCDIYF